ncbi:methyltransferase [Leptotrichia sp. OH3620_COT-345]|uniref:tRNA1(Val) (adenine(37)-N6)-methyltransferase n=1 Tax=Leptotrichia sp. OH3620_COT-345 TaxID=2491048 RepID=UPI000F653ECE|nr:methyltransferase [Leptotrichia sp. OH3620_COT-345]RRD39413.1 methyltransferase [Leptotrichia sp. OH3620_COT-345]
MKYEKENKNNNIIGENTNFLKKENLKSHTERLKSVDKVVIIRETGLKITEDALLLAKFIKNIFMGKSGNVNWTFIKNKTILEIGAGQGIISILLSEIQNISKIYAVEVQKKIYEYLVDNIKKNCLEDKILTLNEDIKNINGKYDYIFSNPPYKKINSGKLPEDESIKISKYEVGLTLEELFFNIKRLLKNYGEFFVVVPNYRLNDSFSYIYKNGLKILNLEINEYKKVKLVIIHGKKGGEVNSGIEITYEKR